MIHMQKVTTRFNIVINNEEMEFGEEEKEPEDETYKEEQEFRKYIK